MTDHFIARRPPAGDLLAEKPERAETAASSYQGEVVPYYPAKLASTADNDLTVAVAQVREQSNLKAGLPLLASQIAKYHPTQPGYYAELAEGYLAVGDPASAIRSFEEASRLDPESAPRLIQWGDALMQARAVDACGIETAARHGTSAGRPASLGQAGMGLVAARQGGGGKVGARESDQPGYRGARPAQQSGPHPVGCWVTGPLRRRNSEPRSGYSPASPSGD